MILVLNEWIFHDLLGENGEVAKSETAKFLNTFYESRDGLVLPTEQRWLQKAYQLMTLTDPRLRITSQQFHTLLQNSTRTIDTRSEAPSDLPNELVIPTEDVYLVEAYMCAKADVLITTDEGLHEALSIYSDVNCQLRKDFLAQYNPQA